jgi:phosphate acetyltransferase
VELVQKIRENAKKHCKRIVLAEGTDERTLRAADIAVKEGLAAITVLGNESKIREMAAKFGLSGIEKLQIIDPLHHSDRQRYAEIMVGLRKSKGLTQEGALKLLDDPLYYAAIMIKAGDADGEVAGAANATGDVLRPAFQFIKTKPGTSIVSSAFFLQLKDTQFGEKGLFVFADCAVNPNPNAQELAEIAVSTADTARILGEMDPKVAMLSFSTMGSAHNEYTEKVVNATQLVKSMRPDIKVDGEIQLDAAIIPEIGQRKAPGSAIAGKANVLIFPTLEAGNIGYKLVERLAHAQAVGPVLQGMAAPVNDLSRGCNVEDIVNVIAITVLQAAGSDLK